MRHSQPSRGPSGLVLCLALGGAMAGCQSDKPEGHIMVDQGPMYTGPNVFKGTIGSLVQFVNDEPQQVSGYGLVVRINGAGSGEVPPGLLPYMKDQVRRAHLDPTTVLSSHDTAVVSVQGLIPPGAVTGDRFDLWVESTASSVASLAGGNLFSTDLQPGPPARDPGRYVGLSGSGSGFIYMDPFDQDSFAEAGAGKLSWAQFQRQALILGGGRVGEPRALALTLNQPSFSTASKIVDAINTRFKQGHADRMLTAVARDDQHIVLNVPAAWHRNPTEFIDQVRWLYIQRIDPAFVPAQTDLMLKALAEEPKAEFADHCVQAWKAMDKGALGKLRLAYTLAEGGELERRLWPTAEKDPAVLAKRRAGYATVRDAAVRAGIALGDADAVELLARAIPQMDAAGRRRAAEMLAEFPNNQGVLSVLRSLIADPDTSVRVAAYEAYAACYARLSGDYGVQITEQQMGDFHRTFAYDGNEEPRYAVDVVPIGEPLVVMTLSGWPRVAILGRETGMKKPSSVWFEGDAGRHRETPDAAAMDKAAQELAAKTGLSLAEAKAQMAKLEQDSAAIPFAGVGRLNLRAQDEVTAEAMRTATARQLLITDKSIPNLAEAMKQVPETREVLAFSFYPGDRIKQEFKATNTLATLAFTLGQHSGAKFPQPGLDFQFDRVTRVFYQLAKRGLISAPVEIRLSPLADRMRRAAEAARKPNEGRPEGAVEDLTKELGAGAKPKAPPAANPADKKPDAAPAGSNPFKQ